MSEVLRILVVEDNPADVDFIHEMLPKTGPMCFQIESVSRLSEALPRLERKDIDLVLLDLGLPDSHGLPTFQKLRAVVPDVPVIVLTGSNDQELAVTAVRDGAQDYLVKGQVSGSLLARAARYALERKRIETAIQEERQRFNDILEKLPVMICLLTPDYHVPFANRRFRELFGEAHGQRCFEYIFHRTEPCPECQSFIPLKTHAPHHWEWIIPNGNCLDIYDFPFTDVDNSPLILEMNINITERKRAENQELLTRETLELLNRPASNPDTIRDILLLIKQSTGMEAIGIRLREGDDFPYYVANGFPEDFVCAERYLCARDHAGELVRDSKGNLVLECMCGNILCGRTNPALPFFTAGGSFWTNSTTQLLATTTEADRQARTRNRCNSEGYESVALIPLRSGDEIIGLLQLNDRRPGRFTPELIRFCEGLAASIGVALKRGQAAEALRQQTEELRARNQELTAFNRVAVGRELRMIELKQEINELCRRLSEPPLHAMDSPPRGGGDQ